MDIDEDALKNFKNSKFNFVDSDGNDVDYSNLSDDTTYTLRDGDAVVQDNMKAQNVVNTINNEYGKNVNV